VNEARVGRGIDALTVQLGSATADFFPLLGVRPARGRFFTPAEDSPPEGAAVIVLDYGYWVREFAGSDAAIGRTLIVGGKAFTIIGVAPRGFTGAELRPVDLWIPTSASSHPRSDWPVTWRAQWLNVVVRLKPGLTSKQIDDDLTAAFRANYGGTEVDWKRASISARNIAFTSNGKERAEAAIARWLGAVALLVLLIAAANAANLLIVRTLRRYHETAIRLALGISRRRLLRLLFLESTAYAVLGCAIGLVLARAGGETIRRVLLPTIAWDASPLSPRVVLFSALLTFAVAVVIGLAPVLQLRATALVPSLQGGASFGVSGSRARRVLLVAQMAISVALLVGAGLFIRSLVNVRNLDLGVEPGHVLVARVGWPAIVGSSSSAVADHARITNAWRELRDRVAHYPGVAYAALAIGSPFGDGFGVDVRVPGRDTLPAAPGGGPYISAVTPEYFAVTGTSIARGRSFATSDGPQAPHVAVVNETMASLLWPNEDAIGKCIVVNEAGCFTVVGVARDARRWNIQEPPAMQYYVPLGQESGISGPVLLVRPVRDARAFTQTLRRAIVAASPSATFLNVGSMQDRVDGLVRPWRVGATMFTVFGVLALIVAAVGLYSVVAYSTAQRTREFGIRLAIGSSGVRLMRVVLAEAVTVAVIGVAIGGIIALVGGARIAPLLFKESPRDPLVFVTVTGVFVFVALLAALIPALKAAGTDPMIALRSM